MPRHRTFRHTPSGPAAGGDARSLEGAMDGIFQLQCAGAIAWVLVTGMLLCGQSPVVMLWLPLNYTLFDLYLFAREGLGRLLGRSSFARCSKAARGFLDLSPVLMVGTTPFLGAAGSALHAALGLWAS